MGKNIITNRTFDEERALYNLKDTTVKSCKFEGGADGESALKESRNVEVSNCLFALRYPLWHSETFVLNESKMENTCRAPIWYARDGVVSKCILHGVKLLRECKNIVFKETEIVSPEFGWKCGNISFDKCKIDSEYCLFESTNVTLTNIDMTGKYSFQYNENLKIKNCVLNTKDAFWHSKNVTVENSVVNGEYLGWYSEGLTLINCKIKGTQPFCYCKKLKVIDCTMEDTDLSFEYSDVEADIKSEIVSVKNPVAGYINAEKIGEIILDNPVYENKCVINVKSK